MNTYKVKMIFDKEITLNIQAKDDKQALNKAISQIKTKPIQFTKNNLEYAEISEK